MSLRCWWSTHNCSIQSFFECVTGRPVVRVTLHTAHFFNILSGHIVNLIFFLSTAAPLESLVPNTSRAYSSWPLKGGLNRGHFSYSSDASFRNFYWCPLPGGVLTIWIPNINLSALTMSPTPKLSTCHQFGWLYMHVPDLCPTNIHIHYISNIDNLGWHSENVNNFAILA